ALVLALFLRAESSARRRDYVLAGVVMAVLGAIRPHDLLHLFLAVIFYSLIGAATHTMPAAVLWRRVLVLTMLLPLAAYYYWLFRIHPVFRWWPAQTMLLPPDLDVLAVGLGITCVLLLWGLCRAANLKDRPAPQVLIACCAFVSLVCVSG